MLAGEAERARGPRAADDLQLLGEPVHPHAHRREREAVGLVLGLPPAGADAQLDPAAGDPVGGEASLASTDGWRKVAGETSVPRRIVDVVAASAHSVPQASSALRSRLSSTDR